MNTEQQLKIERLVGEQLEGEFSLLRDFELYDPNRPGKDDVPPPADADTASRLLITKLTTQQVVEILARVNKPQIELAPVTSFERYVRAIDGHPKMPDQVGTYVNATRRAVWARQDAAVVGKGDRIIGWELGITDATPDLDADRTLNGNLGQQREQAEGVLSGKGLRLLSPHRHALAAIRALNRGKPLAARTWEVLNDNTGDDSVVPDASWDASQVFFDGAYPEYQEAGARFRPEAVVRAA